MGRALDHLNHQILIYINLLGGVINWWEMSDEIWEGGRGVELKLLLCGICSVCACHKYGFYSVSCGSYLL